MAKLNKKQLAAALKKLGVEVDIADKKLTNPKLEKMLVKAQKKADKEATDETPPESTGDKPPARIKPEASAEDKLPESTEEKGDYLKKYQYIKDLPLGHASSDPSPGSKAARMKKKLLKQEPVRIIIMREAGEAPSILASVNLNGYRLDFPKQTYIEVPEQIARIIMKSQKQQEEALEFMRIDRADQKTKDALNE